MQAVPLMRKCQIHMKPPVSALLVLAVLPGAGFWAGCGDTGRRNATASTNASNAARALALDLARTRPLGHGTRFRPPAVGALVRAYATVDELRCGMPGKHPYAAHIELFARGHEIVVPAGIGIAPPQQRMGATVDGGRCTYPIRTVDPTGVILVDPVAAAHRQPTIGDLFRLWGQPLDLHRLAGFIGGRRDVIVAFLDGRRVLGNPNSIPLQRHSQIVLELGQRVAPHPSYRFAPGL